MTYGRAIAAQLKAQQDVMNANFQQEKESLVNALKLVKLHQRQNCARCVNAMNDVCSEQCSWQQIRNILKGVAHEI